MFGFKKEIICPVCVTRIDYNDVRYHCQNTSCDKFERRVTRQVLISRRQKTNSKGLYVCEDCGSNLIKICETCKTDLPVDIESISRRTVAVFGIRASGKSSYIGSLLREMYQLNSYGNYHVDSRYFSDEIQNTVEFDYINPLKNARLLDATHAGESKVISSNITISIENPKPKQENFILTIFDMAGESFTDRTSMKTADRKNYMKDLSGIIFLIDPLMDGNKKLINEILDKQDMNPESVQHQRALTNVIDYLKVNAGIKTSQKIDIPTAFVVGKVDVLEKSEKYSTMNIFRKPNFINDKFEINLDEVKKNHQDIEKMLLSWASDYKNGDIGAFINSMKSSFSNYRLFGVSALGKDITSTSVVETNPIRLFEPLLWLFHKDGLIKESE